MLPCDDKMSDYLKATDRVELSELTKEYREALASVMRSNLDIIGTDKDLRYGVQALFYRSNRQRIDIT